MGKGKLSDRQRRMLEFIQRFGADNRYPPSIREIGEAVGISSTSVVNYNLNRLVEEGYLDRHQNVSRGIRLTDKVTRAAERVADVIRVPLVPGVTDTLANLAAIADLAGGLSGLERVDLLPYNRAAGAKYEAVGRRFAPDYDETQAVNANTAVFEQAGIRVRVT